MRVVEGASLFNIDFAAGLFSGIKNSEEGIYILLNNNPPYSDNAQFYEYVSRLAIPTIEWTFCSDEIWRLKFIPTKNQTKKDVSNALINLKDRYVSLLANDGFEEINKFEERFGLIQKELEKSENLILFYKEVICLIYKRVLFRQKVKVSLSGGFLKMDTTDHNVSEYLFKEIYSELKNKKTGVYKLVKGGKLVFKIGDNIYNCNKIEKKQYSFVFYDREQDSENIEIAFEKIIQGNLPKFALKCEGPIQMLLLQHFGILCHLPWYMPAKKALGEFKCIEFITPISNSYQHRTSKFINGGSTEMRLSPSGYSLLDYEHPRVLTLISYLLNIYPVTWGSLYDWKFLINNYPVTREKLAEHQGSVNRFIDIKIKDKLKKLRNNGCNKQQNELLISEDKLDFLTIGDKLIDIAVLLKYFRNLITDENEIKLTPNQIDFFLASGVSEFVDLDILLVNLTKSANIIGSKLIEFGFPKEKWILIDSELKERIRLFNENYEIPIKGESSTDLYRRNKYFGKLNMDIKKVLHEYYKFVSFFSSTVLKANIFTSYLLFGEKEYSELIKVLIKERGIKTFKYNPVFFKEL